jgi:endonuclease/exonuclease/phosphatase family metal-dependent hydrolase
MAQPSNLNRMRRRAHVGSKRSPADRLRAGTVVVAVIVAVAVLALAGETRTRTERLTILQFNLCGNACNRGALGVVSNLATAIHTRQPFAVTLNEVCENQYAWLRADLDHYHGRFEATGPRCRNGARYGNAVMLRTTRVTHMGSWSLPNPARDEIRRLVCVGTSRPGIPSLAVCATHISNVAGNIAPQLTAVADVLTRLDADHAVLLGGDLNVVPADARMDSLYDTCYATGRGRFVEADSAGSAGCASRALNNAKVGAEAINQHTYAEVKFDYIFLSKGDWSLSGADVTDVATGLSDHKALWAYAALEPGAVSA